MSSQSGYHSTEDDFDGPAKSPPRSSPGGAPEEQPGDAAALRSQLQDLTVSSQGEIAYWKAQLEQSKQDMVEILGHAENLSQACEELEDEGESDVERPTVRPPVWYSTTGGSWSSEYGEGGSSSSSTTSVLAYLASDVNR